MLRSLTIFKIKQMERKFEPKTDQNKPLGSIVNTEKNKDFDLDATTVTEKQKKKQK